MVYETTTPRVVPCRFSFLVKPDYSLCKMTENLSKIPIEVDTTQRVFIFLLREQ